jgi:hypothetical protein
MFKECSRSSLDGVVSLYALGDAFVLTMNGPSHFGSSLPRDCPSCSDEYEVPFVEFSWDDCVVAPDLRLSLVFVEGLQGEDTVSVDEVFGGWFVYVGDGGSAGPR